MPLPTPLHRRTFSALLASLMLPLHVRAAPRDHADVDGTLLREAVDDPRRSAANRVRDTARHPFETLRFFGIAPGQTVVEIAPGGGWYSEILAPYLHDHGRFYAAHEPADGSDGQRAARERFKAKMAADREAYGRAVVGTMPDPGKGFTDIRPAHGADAVLTFRNIHNWIEHGELDGMLRAFHAVLKPGGVLGVEEHRAPEGTSLDQVMRTGYVPETLVIERANAAGFKLAAKSEVNANPLDTKDHPNGVWSLPPTLRGGATDRARFIAIGESDRMTLKFIKPMA